MKQVFLRIHPKDNILAALQDIEKGYTIDFEGDSFETVEAISAKHKFALTSFAPSDEIIMYGALVGAATKPIAKGERISIENCEHASAEYGVSTEQPSWEAPFLY